MRYKSAWLLCVLASLACVQAQDLKRRPETSAPAEKTQPVLVVPPTLAPAKLPNADAVYQNCAV